MARNLLLVRHGLIRANVQGRWHGSTDSPLLWRGRRQARRTAKRLHGNEPRPVAIYTSPLTRCQNTAAPIAKRLELETPIIADDLREYAIGEWEDMRFKDLAKEHNFVARAIDDPTFAPPAGESLQGVAQRIRAALVEIHEKHDDHEDVIVVSHGAIMGVALASLLDGNPGQWPDYHLDNCSVTELSLGDTPFVGAFNCTKHL